MGRGIPRFCAGCGWRLAGVVDVADAEPFEVRCVMCGTAAVLAVRWGIDETGLPYVAGWHLRSLARAPARDSSAAEPEPQPIGVIARERDDWRPVTVPRRRWWHGERWWIDGRLDLHPSQFS